MKTRTSKPGSVESQAAAWLARRDGGLTAQETSEFARWRAADPRHAEAVARIEAVWFAFDRPAEHGHADRLEHRLASLARRDRRRWTAAGMGSALAAACVVMVLWIQPPDDAVPAATAPVSARIIVPERQTLPDGSVVDLMPGAQIAAVFSGHERRVALKNGGAHFAVTKDSARPFIVEAAGLHVRAVGTAFVVQWKSAEVEVLVTEGRVAVETADEDPETGLDEDAETGRRGDAESSGVSASPRPRVSASSSFAPTLVDAGHRLLVEFAREGVPVARAVPMASVELIERLAWRLPRLDFTDTSIAEAVALFNRHNALRIRIGDDEVSSHRITGVFRSDNIDGFVRALESTFGVRAERRDDGIVLRISAAQQR